MGPPRAACKRAHVRARIGLIAPRDNKPPEAQQMFSTVRRHRETCSIEIARKPRAKMEGDLDDRRENPDVRSYAGTMTIDQLTTETVIVRREYARANYQ